MVCLPKKSKAQGQTIKKILFRKKIILYFFLLSIYANCSTIPNSKITDDNFIEACLVLGALGKFWHTIRTIVQIIVNLVFTPSLYRCHLYEGYKYPFEILSFFTIYQKTRRCFENIYSFFRIRLYREMFQSVTAMRKKNDMQFDW